MRINRTEEKLLAYANRTSFLQHLLMQRKAEFQVRNEALNRFGFETSGLPQMQQPTEASLNH